MTSCLCCGTSKVLTHKQLQQAQQQIKSLFKNLYNNIPEVHSTLMYCGTCAQDLRAELVKEKETLALHKQETQIPKRGNILVCTVLLDTDSWYKQIKMRFNETMSNEVIRIEQITNDLLRHRFDRCVTNIKGDRTVRYLFHGSNNQNYDQILASGFSLALAKETGALGPGIYFAQDASYSNAFTYSINTTAGNIKNMLVCRVVFGEIPQNTRESAKTWAVYSEEQCCPAFIVYYKDTV